MKKTSQNTVFSFAVYREGLKKIRVTGIAVSILVLVINAIVPLVHILAEGSRKTIGVVNFSVPMLIILFAAPLFIFNMYGFLNNRSEADFYHALPQKRICVYLSLTAAVLTWMWGIILASTALTALMWALDPHAVLSLSCLYLVPMAYMLMTLFIAGVMTVAMMLTGTTVTNWALALLILTLVRIVGLLYTTSLEYAVWMFKLSGSVGEFLSPEFSVLYKWFVCMINSSVDEFYTAVPMLIYTFVVSVLLLAAGGWLYHIRKSEMAGQSAPGRRLHHLFRNLFVLPFALLLTNAMLGQWCADREFDVSADVILTVLMLLVCLLYELITTKSWKRMLKAVPKLWTVAVVCIVFVGSILGIKAYVLSSVPNKTDVDAVVILDNFYMSWDPTYESLITKKIALQSDEVNALVADKLAQAADAIKSGDNDEGMYSVTLDVVLKNGKKQGRCIGLSQEEYFDLLNRVNNSAAYHEKYVMIPPENEVSTCSLLMGRYGYTYQLSDKYKAVYNAFAKEYAALSDEAKINVKTAYDMKDDTEDNALFISVTGAYNGKLYTSHYYVGNDMPQTRQAIADAVNELYASERNLWVDSLGKMNAETFDDDTAYFSLCFLVPGLEVFTNVDTQETWYSGGAKLRIDQSPKYKPDDRNVYIADVCNALKMTVKDLSSPSYGQDKYFAVLDGYVNIPDGEAGYYSSIPVLLSSDTVQVLLQLYETYYRTDEYAY